MDGKVSNFAERLQIGLDQRNIKAADLARISGIDKSSISRYLKGKYKGNQDAVYKIAKALDVSEAWLMGYDVPMERESYDALLQAAEDRVYFEQFDALSKEEKEAALSSVNTNKIHPKGEREVSDDDIKFALFGGDSEITDAMYDEVKRFAQMVKLREEAERKKE